MDASAKLNSLDHYPSLMERSKRVGYAVTKVVFRGYQASDQLQVQHVAFTDCIGQGYTVEPPDTLGAGCLSFVERLSLSRRFRDVC